MFENQNIFRIHCHALTTYKWKQVLMLIITYCYVRQKSASYNSTVFKIGRSLFNVFFWEKSTFPFRYRPQNELRARKAPAVGNREIDFYIFWKNTFLGKHLVFCAIKFAKNTFTVTIWTLWTLKIAFTVCIWTLKSAFLKHKGSTYFWISNYLEMCYGRTFGGHKYLKQWK